LVRGFVWLSVIRLKKYLAASKIDDVDDFIASMIEGTLGVDVDDLIIDHIRDSVRKVTVPTLTDVFELFAPTQFWNVWQANHPTDEGLIGPEPETPLSTFDPVKPLPPRKAQKTLKKLIKTGDEPKVQSREPAVFQPVGQISSAVGHIATKDDRYLTQPKRVKATPAHLRDLAAKSKPEIDKISALMWKLPVRFEVGAVGMGMRKEDYEPLLGLAPLEVNPRRGWVPPYDRAQSLHALEDYVSDKLQVSKEMVAAWKLVNPRWRFENFNVVIKSPTEGDVKPPVSTTLM
jgi:hypothetical protein